MANPKGAEKEVYDLAGYYANLWGAWAYGSDHGDLKDLRVARALKAALLKVEAYPPGRKVRLSEDQLTAEAVAARMEGKFTYSQGDK